MAPHAVLDLHSILSDHLIAADELKKGGWKGVSECEREGGRTEGEERMSRKRERSKLVSEGREGGREGDESKIARLSVEIRDLPTIYTATDKAQYSIKYDCRKRYIGNSRIYAPFREIPYDLL